MARPRGERTTLQPVRVARLRHWDLHPWTPARTQCSGLPRPAPTGRASSKAPSAEPPERAHLDSLAARPLQLPCSAGWGNAVDGRVVAPPIRASWPTRKYGLDLCRLASARRRCQRALSQTSTWASSSATSPSRQCNGRTSRRNRRSGGGELYPDGVRPHDFTSCGLRNGCEQWWRCGGGSGRLAYSRPGPY